MAIRFIKFPEIENAKERSALEYAWLERQQAEEQKKNQQNYINFGELPDDIVKPAVLWAYYQGLSVLPRAGHVYFQTVTVENVDGEIEVVALQPKIQYQGEIHLAVHGENARYRAVEMLIDGRRLGTESMDNIAFDLNSHLTVRVIDLSNQARSITQTIGACFEHGLEHSPTLGKFKKSLDKFWEGYEKYKNGDTSLFNPWYANPLAMSAKTLWRKIDGQDKITNYSEEYLEEVREAMVSGLILPDIRVDFTTGEVLEAKTASDVVDATPMIETKAKAKAKPKTKPVTENDDIVIEGTTVITPAENISNDEDDDDDDDDVDDDIEI